jgi:micrococcal nuclease
MVAPPGGPDAGSALARLWSRFRAAPVWVQTLGWVLAWPLIGALLIASGPHVSRLRYALAAVALFLGGTIWIPIVTGSASPATVEVEPAEDALESRDAAAARAAGEDDAERLATVEARAAAKERAERNLTAAEERFAEAQARSAEAKAGAEAAAKIEAEATAAAEEKAAAEARQKLATGWTVFNVVDGDTVDVRAANGTEERVRVIGIDTPERGECGFGEAASAMALLVGGEQVELVAGARDDRDRYGRILRYVDVAGVDAGLNLIQQGLAISRYDSRDGYGRHDREAEYLAADQVTETRCSAPEPPPATKPAPAPPPGSGPGTGPAGAWKNCAEAREHGAAPVRRGDPGYGGHLDRDNDGIGCE